MHTSTSENKHPHACACGHDHYDHGHDCGCGHDHHDHGHDCGCGHDHHDHERDCGCEHDHHDHGRDCGCGHNHHHENIDGKKLIYILENLGCANCAAKMEARIRELPGVKHAAITFATRQLQLIVETQDDLLPRIQKICADIESQVRVVEKSAPPAKPDAAKGRLNEDQIALIQIIIGAILFIGGEVMMHLGFSEMQILPIFAAGYLLMGGKILLEAARNIFRGQIFDENFLMCIATLGAFAIGEFPEAMGVMLFFRVGEYFEHRAVERSRSQIMQAVDMRPECVNRLDGDEAHIIPASEARVGDILLIRPGDRIPLDGIIIDGESRLDTSPITGEPVPVAVKKGDAATSGCMNTSGQLKLRVEKPLSESMVSRILNAVENAAANKPRIDRFITRFARIYTPCVVGIALATAILPSLISGNWHYWIYTAITFLVMSCPCALVLSVPLAFFSGIGAGSRKGILFKGGSAMEALAQVGAVVMDKTGTITQGNFILQRIIPTGDFDETALLQLCAGCEQHSSHPIAHSILEAARQRGISIHAPASMQEIAGHGVEATMDERHVLCGNRKLMEKHHIDLRDAQAADHGAEIFIAIDGHLAGIMIIADTIKPDAQSAISQLKDMHLHTVMFTGDGENSARAVANQTGIHQVHAQLLPQGKLDLLPRIRSRYGRVMFVGDGINDAPVLAGADVGAAMGSGADAAIEAADAVFMTGSMHSIPESIQIARRTSRIAMQNVIFALAIKLAVMILGLCGFANMWMAVFADTGVAMLCVLNSIRALYKK